MSTKNLHIKSFTLIPSCLFFYAKVKIYTSSLLHCYQLPIFLTKVHICWSSFLLWISSFLYLYGMQFFPCLYNFVEGIKNIYQVYSFINQEGLVMTRLKELGRSGNYVLWNSTWPWLWISSFPTWRNFLKLFCLCSTKATHVWNYRRDGDQAEFLSRRLQQYE